jgi:hypothetical protein
MWYKAETQEEVPGSNNTTRHKAEIPKIGAIDRQNTQIPSMESQVQ